MLFLPILLAAAASLASAAAVNLGDEKLQFRYYCNDGTDGDDNCEEMGLNTYCCNKSKWGPYKTPRTVALEGHNMVGSNLCDHGNGSIYCA